MGADDVSLKVAEVSRQAAIERAQLMDEIINLKDERSRSASQPDAKINTEVGDTVSA
jgi:CAP-Gly domain-containing linker protein 1